MNIRVHIERLVIDAGALPADRIAHIAEAIELAIADQLGQPRSGLQAGGDGLAASFPQSQVLPAIGGADQVVQTIASSILSGIGGQQ